MSNGKKSIYSNLITIGSYNYSHTLLRFLASVFLARLLDPEEYGIVAMITVFTGFVSYFKDSGISYVLIREDYGWRFYRMVQWLSIIVGLSLMGLILMLAYPITLFYEEPLLFLPTCLISFVLLIETANVVPMAVLKKELRFKEVGQVLFIGYVSGSLLTILLAYLEFSYWSLIWGQLFSVLLISVLLQRRVCLLHGEATFTSLNIAWRKVKHTSLNVTGSRFIQYWSSNADNLIIGKSFGAYSLGIYSKAYQLMTMQMNLISGVFNSVLLPSLKEDMKLSKEELIIAYNSALKLMSLVILPVTISLVLFAKPIIILIWGKDWVSVAPIASYFGVLSIPFVLSRTFGNIYVLLKKENLLFKLGLFSSVITVIAIIIGSLFGLEEVALALSSVYIMIVLPATLFIAFYKSFQFDLKRIIYFWGFKIVLSMGLLVGLYLNHVIITQSFMLLLAIDVIVQGRIHIYKLVFRLLSWIRK
ncbi:MAG: oligosaccharide flippase family protein [Fulvivirga sp.]